MRQATISGVAKRKPAETGDFQEVGKVIREWMESKGDGWTRKDVAAACGVKSEQAVANWLHGTSWPREWEIRRVLIAEGVDRVRLDQAICDALHLQPIRQDELDLLRALRDPEVRADLEAILSRRKKRRS